MAHRLVSLWRIGNLTASLAEEGCTSLCGRPLSTITCLADFCSTTARSQQVRLSPSLLQRKVSSSLPSLTAVLCSAGSRQVHSPFPGRNISAGSQTQPWLRGTLDSAGCTGARGFASSGTAQQTGRAAAINKKSSEQALYLAAMTVGMIGVTYASVPLYRMFCQATGYGGTVAEGQTVEDKIRARAESPDEAVEAAAAARELTVSFNADVMDGLPWKFMPTQRSVKVKPGQSTLAFYTAENRSDKAITGVSTYNVTPQQAGVYFNKIQCFCFEEQKLRPGEKIDMPVFFYVDPEFAVDKRLNNVNHLTLSYTFFKVSEDEEEDEDAQPVAAVAAT